MQCCRNWGRLWHSCSFAFQMISTFLPPASASPSNTFLGSWLCLEAGREQPPPRNLCVPSCLWGLGEPGKSPAMLHRAGKQIF